MYDEIKVSVQEEGDFSMLKMQCYVCNEENHISIHCPQFSRVQGNLQRGKKKALPADIVHKDEPVPIRDESESVSEMRKKSLFKRSTMDQSHISVPMSVPMSPKKNSKSNQIILNLQ